MFNFTAVKLPENRMMSFLPKVIGGGNVFLGIKFEGFMFSIARSFCEKYDGGSWDFWTVKKTFVPDEKTAEGVSLQGGFMVMRGENELLEITNPMNHFSGQMTAFEFGLGCSLMAYSYLLSSTKETVLGYEALGRGYNALYDYICYLGDVEPDKVKNIWGFID